MLKLKDEEKYYPETAVKRILRRLNEPNAILALSNNAPQAMVLRQSKDTSLVRTATLSKALARILHRRGWVEKVSSESTPNTRYRITSKGQEKIHQLLVQEDVSGLAEAPIVQPNEKVWLNLGESSFLKSENLFLKLVGELNDTEYTRRYNLLNEFIDLELTPFEKELLATINEHEFSRLEQVDIAKNLRATVDALIQARTTKQILSVAPILWKNRTSKKQQPHEFIQETYFDAGHEIDRTTLRKLDRTLLATLEKQERDPERSPPNEFVDRLPRKGEKLEADLKKAQETGDLPTEWRERMRLEAGARRRGIKLGD